MSIEITTIRVILAGLMALSDAEGGGKVATMVAAEHHKVSVYLMEGDFVDGPEPYCSDEFRCFKTWDIPPEAVLSIRDAAGPVESKPLIEPTLVTDDLAGEDVYLPGAGEVDNLVWVPSIDSIVMGETAMMRPCMRPDQHCAGAAARLFLHGGVISACHLIHVHEQYTHGCPCSSLGEEQPPPETLFTYRIRNHGRRAVANALLFEQRTPAAQLEINWRYQGKVQSLVVAPASGKITLVISNDAADSGTGSHVPPKRLSHFDALYSVANRWYARRLYGHEPRRGKPSQFEISPGICETYMECLWGPEDFTASDPTDSGTMVPEAPSECDIATYP